MTWICLCQAFFKIKSIWQWQFRSWYISISAREERVDELRESIKSVSETILLLTKQKEQYANLDKFQQAADVNTSITEKVAEKRKLQKELKALQDAREKSKTYKKKKIFQEK